MKDNRSTENRYADWLSSQPVDDRDKYNGDYRKFQTFIFKQLDEIRQKIAAMPVKESK